MAKKPNYSFEKRQKELARQAKKAEKKQRKLAGLDTEDDQEQPETGSEAEPKTEQD
jgi:hypothetical protein